ncbi:hypothetical protein ACFYU8_17700 [Brevibacillus sp. NPDC003359]|uniref:hypothetical protein n=1 Tax=unclassified Brevibacillus TaxID=2684853 RepID=UPI0036A0E54D
MPLESTIITYSCIALSLILIIMSVRLLMKKVKRKIRKWGISGLVSGKALLITTLIFSGSSDAQALLDYTPSAFQKTLVQSKFDIDYEDNRLVFASDRGVTGTMGISKSKIQLSIVMQLGAPKALETTKQLVTSFTSNTVLQKQIDEVLRKKSSKRISIQNGYIEINGGSLYLHVEKPFNITPKS